MKHLLSNWVVLASTAFLLTGCLETGSSAGHSSYSSQDPASIAPGSGTTPPRSTVRVDFDPENQVIPFPNNILFEAGAASEDSLNGTLNVPIADPNSAEATVSLALNDLTGFSTTESWRVAFKGDIDPGSLKLGDTVRVFEFSHHSDIYPERIRPTANEFVRELTDLDLDIDYIPDTFVVKIRPKKVLKKDHTYSVIFTKGIKDPAGAEVGTPITGMVATGTTALEMDDEGYPAACDKFERSSVAMLQCATHFAIAPVIEKTKGDSKKISREDIIIGWAITTQKEDTVFSRLAKAIKNREINPSIPSATCKTAICFLDVGSLPNPDTAGATRKKAAETPGKKAYIYPGTIRLPLFTPVPSQALTLGDNNYTFGKSSTNSTIATTQYWECNNPSGNSSCNTDEALELESLPKLQAWVTHPIVLAVPKAKAPNGGYPLVVFQHAIQQDRTNALALADKLAEQGFAVVAIDMPLHGIVKHNLPSGDARADLYAGALNEQLYTATANAARDIIPLKIERTFYLDLIAGDKGIDDSGAHFLNPALPLVQRDILRQGALDLVTLVRYLRNGEYSQCGRDGWGLLGSKVCISKSTKNFDLFLKNHVNFNKLHYIGHSVGNIVAAPFLAFDQDIETISMLAPSGSILRTLEGSEVIGPKLKDGLAAKNILPGSENYYRFFASVGAVLDGIEPLNHANAITKKSNASDRPIYMAVIKGDDDNSGDKVLPLSVIDQPLAGSQAMIAALGLKDSSNLLPNFEGSLFDPENSILQVVALFRRGDHASFLQAKSDIKGNDIVGADPHSEMQRQVADFLKNNGTQITNIPANFLQ